MNADLPSPSNEIELPDVLMIAEAARLLRLHRETVSEMCASGVLPAVDLGTGKYRKWRIAKSAVEQFLNQSPPPDERLVL